MKPIKEMSDKEILRQQLEILAKYSLEESDVFNIAQISDAMANIYRCLNS